MGSDSFDMESSKKKSGCQRWQVAVICSLLIAIGLGVGLGVGLSNQNTSSETGPGPWTDYRLPDYIIPSHYALTLHPNMSTDTYTGVNAMTISITQATDYVLVHVDAKLNVMMTQLQLMGDNGNYNDITIKSEFRVPEYEYYVIESSTKLEASEGYLLTMEFEGSLLGRVVGLYKSVYTLPDTGEVKAMVGSDMEPTDARKAYPCFDEPALKIRYTTTLIHEPDHVALSNMHEESNVTREDGLVATTFGMSVPMPTYLGCFAIGEFVYLEKRSEKNNIPLRIYVPPHQLDAGRADYALEVMKVEFDYYEDLFGMDYALPKCDMISIPDFGTGAMENWGLITYRETNLLWDSEESSTHNKQRVAAVVAHELVHQWFGNLVTMKWWDNIWLNEGFASYLEYFGERAAEPTWQIFDHFVIDDLQPVMDFDATVTSHPIVVPVTSPSEITSVFDSISYSKGATVLRYLNNVLGNETFFGGLRNYLWKHQFGNADEQELFEDIQEYIDANTSLAIDVAAIMNPWVHQMGFPVIDVAQDGTVTQSHFLRDPNANLSTRPDSVFDYKWTVSLTYITSQDSAVGEVAFDRTQDSISLPDLNLTEGDWLKLNPGETGYYRVDYDDTMWSTFSEQLINDHTVLTELDRSHLIDDAFNLAPAQLLTYPKALEMTKYLDNERSFFVWDAFDRGSYYIRKMLESTIIYEDFQGFYVTKVKPVADSLGWVVGNESHVDKRNRVLTLSLALAYGDDDALNNATDLFKEWINDAEFKLFPDTRQLVYRYGVINATTEQWEEMLQRYVDAQVASEQSNLLRGLTSTEDIVLLDRMLDNCWDVNVVKSQEFFSCITYISYKPMGNRMAWNWIQLHWEDLVERYEITDRNLGRLVPNIVENYNTELQLWEVENFFERYPEAGAGASGRLTAVDNIKTNIAWMEMNQDTIQNWLNEQ